MTLPVRSLVPLAHVHRVEASIRFYERLGFIVANTFVPPGETEPSWAWLDSGGASFMVGKAGEPVVASQQAVLFYLYVDDVEARRAELIVAGIPCGAITHPFYAERGEFRVEDPDGYVLMITHTSEAR
jgi:hypothetical protein